MSQHTAPVSLEELALAAEIRERISQRCESILFLLHGRENNREFADVETARPATVANALPHLADPGPRLELSYRIYCNDGSGPDTYRIFIKPEMLTCDAEVLPELVAGLKQELSDLRAWEDAETKRKVEAETRRLAAVYAEKVAAMEKKGVT